MTTQSAAAAGRPLVGAPQATYQAGDPGKRQAFIGVVRDDVGDLWHCGHRHPTVGGAQGCANFAILRYRDQGRLKASATFATGDLVQVGEGWRQVIGLQSANGRAIWLQVGPIGGCPPYSWIRPRDVNAHVPAEGAERAVSELLDRLSPTDT